MDIISYQGVHTNKKTTPALPAPWVSSATSNRLNRLETLRRKYATKPTESLRSKLGSEVNVCKEIEDIGLANYGARLFSTRNTRHL